MIALLKGELADRAPEQLVVDVGGVGYRVQIPLSTFYALPEKGPVQLLIHTHVKEDAIHLFGFATDAERQLFGRLLSVSGVGPKLAVNILSNMPVDQLCTALVTGDFKGLASIPGIGKKTAERLVLELRDKVATIGGTETGPHAVAAATGGQTVFDDAISALMNLGYKEAQARKALNRAESGSEQNLDALLKLALRQLMK